MIANIIMFGWFVNVPMGIFWDIAVVQRAISPDDTQELFYERLGNVFLCLIPWLQTLHVVGIILWAVVLRMRRP